MHAVQRERRVGRIQERADVKGRAGVGRNPAGVHFHKRLDGLQTVFLVDARKAETVAGAVQTRDVLPRTEQLHLAIRAAIGLETFKDLGAVVQNACRRGHGDRAKGDDAGVVPAVLFRVVHEEHVVGENRAEAKLVGRREACRGSGLFRDGDFHIRYLLGKMHETYQSSFRCSMFVRMPSQQAWNVAFSSPVSGSSTTCSDAVCADDAGHACEQAASRRTRRRARRWRA